jgi:hypothetical protein
VCVFLPRAVKAPQVKRAMASSKTKFANLLQIRHRDEVEAPITDWLQEAYDFSGAPAVAKKNTASKKPVGRGRSSDRPAAKRTARAPGPTRAARPRR